jgi:hypothetical protein
MPLIKVFLLITLISLSLNTSAFVVYEDTRIWDQDSITFVFLDGTLQQKSEVKRFAKLWERYTGIKFKYTDTKPSKLSFKKYYTISFKGDSNESTRGAIRGRMHLGNLSDNIIFRKTTVLHEFGHMLGLGHEHQRIDRPNSLDRDKMIDACVENQQQSRSWCRDNLFDKNTTEVFIQSNYDAKSIMHYGLKNITGNDLELLEELPDSNANSLSYTDKYFIAMLYNQNISDSTLKKMHQQDLWKQKIFENKSIKETKQNIRSLSTNTCKTLTPGKYSKDGKYCKEGFMVIGKDDYSFPGNDFKTCYTSLKSVQEKMDSHEYCQMPYIELSRKRRLWSKEFKQFGNCKRLETNIKNNQEFFCKEGYSFVTKNNDVIGHKTECYSSKESVFRAMQSNEVCNLNASEFRAYETKAKRKFKQQLKTQYCAVVKKKYKRINCPDGFEFTIIDKSNPNEPINNNCFASDYQAINAMKRIAICGR